MAIEELAESIFRKKSFWVSALAALALLSGCGGGNGDTQAPSEPTLNLNPQAIKTFQFSWNDVAEASEYKLLENPDGMSGFTEFATVSSGQTSHELDVFLPARVNAQYILEACNEAGCTSSQTVAVSSRLGAAIGYFKAANTESSDFFGTSVALSGDGNTLAVGASSEGSGATGIGGDQSDNSQSRSGAVYVFTRDGAGVWSQQAYVKASNAEAYDYFGTLVALSGDGDTLAVGVEFEDSGAMGIGGDQSDNSASDSGAVYVFTRDGAGVWSQQAYVKASNAEAGDKFGSSLALSDDGDTLAVGADKESSGATGIGGDQSDNSQSSSGAVYLFARTGAGVWSQQAYVKASNAEAGDEFGSSLALSGSGDTLAVSANLEDSGATGIGGDQSDNSESWSGAVYVFTRDGAGVWSQQAYVKASNAESSNHFGTSLALSGDGASLTAGAYGEESGATGIGGDQSDNSAAGSGAVYVFTRDGAGIWSQQAYVKASNAEANDFFGLSVALAEDGDTLAVSANLEDSGATGIGGDHSDNSADGSGAIYVFTRDGAGTWSERAYVKASNAEAGDGFGESVALSGDGDTLAVGADEESSGTTGIDGNQNDNSADESGAVYLY